MLSQDSIDRLKYWRLQLRKVIADQEHRLKTLERRILTMGTASAPFLASLKVGKNTLAHLERTQSLLTKLIDAHDLFMDDTYPARGNHRNVPHYQHGAKQADTRSSSLRCHLR